MGHLQDMTREQRGDFISRSIQARKDANKGNNFAYYSEKLEEDLFKKGYCWYNIPKGIHGDITIATASQYHAQDIVKELRLSNHYARIICGVSQNVQRIKMFSIIYKKKSPEVNI